MLWAFEDMSAKRSQGNLVKAAVQVRMTSQSRRVDSQPDCGLCGVYVLPWADHPWAVLQGSVACDPSVHAQSTDPLLVLLFKELASLLLGSEQEQSFLFLFSHAAAQI